MKQVLQTPPSGAGVGAPSSRQRALAVVLLVAVALAAYCNCYNVPFHFDDLTSIEDNMSIRKWSTSFSPPNDSGETVSGRPLLNFTFRVNYAASELDVWSYHAANVMIHIAAGLALFGFVRRTLLMPGLRGKFGRDSVWASCLIAALWFAHPLQTESVTYLVQRAESFMALWYLLALYCFVRGMEKCVVAGDAGRAGGGGGCAPSRGWMLAAWGACLAGMASKEVMASAPVMMLLYDRTFVGGSFRAALGTRWRWYAAFASTWILLALLMIGTGQRGNTVGFTGDVTWWQYGFTQCWALVRYLRLVAWPAGQIFDYGTEVVGGFREIWPQALVVAALVAGAAAAFWRRSAAGWLAVFFFAVIAPTTSVIPVVTQVIAEHRMYLPLSAVMALVVLVSYRFFGRRVFVAGGVAVVALVAASIHRNAVYRDPLVLWKDVVGKRPLSSRANSNYGYQLIAHNRPEEGLRYCVEASRIKPDFAECYNNIGYAYACMEQYEESLGYYRKALSFKPVSRDVVYNNVCFALYRLGRYEQAWNAGMAALRINDHHAPAIVNMGNILAATGRPTEAVERYKQALAINPRQADALNNWGNVVAAQPRPGHLEEALRLYKKAVEYAPFMVDAQDNVARLLLVMGRAGESLAYFEAELALKPDAADARRNYAEALFLCGRVDDAALQCVELAGQGGEHVQAVCELGVRLLKTGRLEDVLRLFELVAGRIPDSDELLYNAGNTLALMGRYEDAVGYYSKAVRLNPRHGGAQQNLGSMLVQLGRAEEALPAFEMAASISPALAPVRHNYALALAQAGRVREAIAQEEEALRLRPGFALARKHLEELKKKASAP